MRTPCGWKTVQTAMHYMDAREGQQQEKLQEISMTRMRRVKSLKVNP